MSKYIQPKKITLTKPDGEEFEFTVYPLHWSFLPDLMKVNSAFVEFQSMNENLDDIELVKKFFELMSDKETVESMFRVIEATIRKSKPDWKDDEVSEFAFAYSQELMKTISDVNMGAMKGERRTIQTGSRVAPSQEKQ